MRQIRLNLLAPKHRAIIVLGLLIAALFGSVETATADSSKPPEITTPLRSIPVNEAMAITVDDLKHLTETAQKGDPAAQVRLGATYESGNGAQRDYVEAARWYRKAAEQGNARAENNLGFLYAKGWGVTQDYTEALKWYRKAAEQSDAAAQNNLGLLYAAGHAVPRDYAEALRWYSKSANLGHAAAQTNLGFMYAKGWGVTQDYTEALTWYRQAAKQNYAPAQAGIGFLYAKGEGVPQDYNEATTWFQRAAEQGYAPAQGILGLFYDHGIGGLPLDYQEAYFWLLLASTSSLTNVFVLRNEVATLLTPQQLSNVHKRVSEWRPTSTALDLNNSTSMQPQAIQDVMVATLPPAAQVTSTPDLHLQNENPLTKPRPRDLKTEEALAAKGVRFAQYELGRLYYEGEGVSRDFEEAYFWLGLATHSGSDAAATYQQAAAAFLSEQQVSDLNRRIQRWKPTPSPITSLWEDSPVPRKVIVHGISHPETLAARDITNLLHNSENGNPEAEYLSGILYEFGYGVPQNYTEAAKWYRKAAERDIALAQYIVGVMYEHGQGVPQNYAESYFWLVLASRSEDKDSTTARDEVAVHLTADQMLALKNRANEWKPITNVKN